MKKTVFSFVLFCLLVLALVHHGSKDDFSDISGVLVSKLSENPLAVEVFSIGQAEAVET